MHRTVQLFSWNLGLAYKRMHRRYNYRQYVASQLYHSSAAPIKQHTCTMSYYTTQIVTVKKTRLSTTWYHLGIMQRTCSCQPLSVNVCITCHETSALSGLVHLYVTKNCIVAPSNILGHWLCMSRKRWTGGGRLVYPKGGHRSSLGLAVQGRI